MTTFQLIITVLATVYVVSSLYFAITGRIINIKQEKKNDENIKKQMDFNDQINVLTNRLGEVMTENTKLNDVIKSWIASANDWKQRYMQLQQEISEKETKGTKKGGK